MSEPLLTVEGLEVVYGHAVRAIQGVSFDVPEGEIVGLAGLNGAGKTTTIRAITGFMPTENVRVSDGRLRFDGQSILGWRPYQTARAGIAVVPEREKVFDTLTVEENLEVALTVRGRLRPEQNLFGSIKSVYEQFPSLGLRSEQLAIYLSGGERQILAIASAMLTGPRLLIVDEASLGLAPQIRRQVLDILAELNRDWGITVLLVDQDVSGVLSVASYGYIIENGRIVFDGTAEALLSHGDVQEFYLGVGEGNGATSYRDVKQYRRVRRWY